MVFIIISHYVSLRDEVAKRIRLGMVKNFFFLTAGGWSNVKSMEYVTVGENSELIKVYSFKFCLREKTPSLLKTSHSH